MNADTRRARPCHAADEGRDRRAPVRQRGRRSPRSRRSACPCSRTPPRRPAPSRSPGAPARSEPSGHVLLLSLQEPGAPSATAASSSTSEPSRIAEQARIAALSRLARQDRPTSSSATTPAWTSSRRRSCAAAARRSLLDQSADGSPAGRTPLRGRRTRGAGGAATSGAGGLAGLASIRRRPSPRGAVGTHAHRCRDRPQGLLPHTRAPPAGDARVGQRGTLPAQITPPARTWPYR